MVKGYEENDIAEKRVFKKIDCERDHEKKKSWIKESAIDLKLEIYVPNFDLIAAIFMTLTFIVIFKVKGHVKNS